MSTLAEPRAVRVEILADHLAVDLADGRRIETPLAWYPRLANASETERSTVEIDPDGYGIHWPLLDEDLSVKGMLAGSPSAEYRKEALRTFEQPFEQALAGQSMLNYQAVMKYIESLQYIYRQQPPAIQAEMRERILKAVA